MLDFFDRIIQKNIFNEQNRKADRISEDKMEQKIVLWGERWSKFCEKQNVDKNDIIVAVQPYLGTGDKKFSNWEKNAKLNNIVFFKNVKKIQKKVKKNSPVNRWKMHIFEKSDMS